MDNFSIKLKIETEERLFEVMNTVPNLRMIFRVGEGWVPDLSVKFWNEGGVVIYSYWHSGTIGLNQLSDKLKVIGEKISLRNVNE